MDKTQTTVKKPTLKPNATMVVLVEDHVKNTNYLNHLEHTIKRREEKISVQTKLLNIYREKDGVETKPTDIVFNSKDPREFSQMIIKDEADIAELNDELKRLMKRI